MKTAQAEIAAVKIKAVLAADIIRALDERGLSVQAAAEAAGLPFDELRRIQDSRLDGFTQERLARILALLRGPGQR